MSRECVKFIRPFSFGLIAHFNQEVATGESTPHARMAFDRSLGQRSLLMRKYAIRVKLNDLFAILSLLTYHHISAILFSNEICFGMEIHGSMGKILYDIRYPTDMSWVFRMHYRKTER